MIVINLAGDSSCAAHRFELDRIAFRDMLYHSRLSVGIALIGTRAVRDDGGVELLAKIAAQLGNAAFGVFRELLRRCPLLDSIDRLARMILKIAEQALQLLFHFFDFGLLVLSTLGGESRPLAFNFLLPSLQPETFGFSFAQFGVQAVKKFRNIPRL